MSTGTLSLWRRAIGVQSVRRNDGRNGGASDSRLIHALRTRMRWWHGNPRERRLDVGCRRKSTAASSHGFDPGTDNHRRQVGTRERSAAASHILRPEGRHHLGGSGSVSRETGTLSAWRQYPEGPYSSFIVFASALGRRLPWALLVSRVAWLPRFRHTALPVEPAAQPDDERRPVEPRHGLDSLVQPRPGRDQEHRDERRAGAGPGRRHAPCAARCTPASAVSALTADR
jgi:hypothetical protein